MHRSLFRRFMTATVVAAFGIFLLTVAAFAHTVPSGDYSSSRSNNAQAGSSYTFTTLNNNNDPTFNQLLGINNHGEIAGYFGSGAANHPNKGHTLSSPYTQGNYTNENFPGSAQTQVTAINNHGYTAGFWVDGNGNNFGFIEWHGVFTSYRNPNTGTGTVNQLLGLNDNGIAVGFYTDGQGINHAYELNHSNGHFSAILPPGATGTTATGINDNGDVTGFLTTSNGFVAGFLLSSPLHRASFQSIDDPNGVGTTTVNGLNDNGALVGFYVDGNGNADGFLAK